MVDAVLSIPLQAIESVDVVPLVLRIPKEPVISEISLVHALRVPLQVAVVVVEEDQERTNAHNVLPQVVVVIVEEGRREVEEENVLNVHLLAAEEDAEVPKCARHALLPLVGEDVIEKKEYASLPLNPAIHALLLLVEEDAYLLSLLSTHSLLASIHISFSTSFSPLVMCGKEAKDVLHVPLLLLQLHLYHSDLLFPFNSNHEGY